MTARAEYTRDEWALLIAAPQAAIGAVVFADGTAFFETISEGVAAAMAQMRGKEQFAGNELVAALIDNKERIEPARLAQPQQVGETPEDVLARLKTLAIEECRDAMALLADRSHPAEAAGYAAWVLESAKAAALARRHGPAFGAKGPAVDAQEREMLELIAEALGSDVGDLPAEVPYPDGLDAGPIHPS